MVRAALLSVMLLAGCAAPVAVSGPQVDPLLCQSAEQASGDVDVGKQLEAHPTRDDHTGQLLQIGVGLGKIGLACAGRDCGAKGCSH